MEIVFCKVENSTAQNLLTQSFQNIDKKNQSNPEERREQKWAFLQFPSRKTQKLCQWWRICSLDALNVTFRKNYKIFHFFGQQRSQSDRISSPIFIFPCPKASEIAKDMQIFDIWQPFLLSCQISYAKREFWEILQWIYDFDSLYPL